MHRLKKHQQLLGIVLGAIILAFGMYNFYYQNDLTEGGILGLLLLLKNVVGISPSITSVILDFSLFFLGSRFLGKHFLYYAIFSTFCFSLSYAIFEQVGFLVPSLLHSPLLASVLGGLCVGIGIGLIVSSGGASGGDDVIVLLVNRFTPLKMNWTYLIMDCTVLILSLCYLPIQQIFWSLIAVTISGKIISLIYYFSEQKKVPLD
ncbi:MAG: YitT family protein [Cellulosilyticaceae bacterium]